MAIDYKKYYDWKDFLRAKVSEKLNIAYTPLTSSEGEFDVLTRNTTTGDLEVTTITSPASQRVVIPATTWDFTDGNFGEVTLTADRSNLTVTNSNDLDVGVLYVIQDSTGGWNLTLNGMLPADFEIITDPDAVTVLSFNNYNGTIYWSMVAQYLPVPLIPLSTPTLTATVISDTEIDLSWTNVSNESSYKLEWSPNGSSSWTQIGGTIAANTTSYNHTGLTGSTHYYYRITAIGDGTTYSDSGYGTDDDTTSVGLDTDAQAFITAVETAGGSFTDPQKAAINTYVVNQKSHGIWAKTLAAYFPVQSSDIPSGINMKNPGTNNLSWGGGTHIFSTSGVTPGSSSFANTGITASSSAISQNSVYMAVYTQTATLTNTYETLIGCNDASNYLWLVWGAAENYANANTGPVSEGSISPYAGYNAINRTGSTTSYLILNGVNVINISTASVAIPSGVPLYFESTRNHLGGITNPSTRKWSLGKITTGLTLTEAADDNDDVEALMDAFGIGKQ